MSDPYFDEKVIIDLLSSPCTLDHVQQHQMGAVQAMMDLYDRGCTREEYADALSKVIGVYAQASKLYVLHNIESVFDEGALSKEKFVDADKRMCDLLRTQSGLVIELMKRLQQCPTSKDKIH